MRTPTKSIFTKLDATSRREALRRPAELGLQPGTRARLPSPKIPTLGVIGAPLLLASNIAVLYDAWDQLDPIAGLLTLPIGVWEFSFGIYMAAKGFRTVPEAAETGFGSNVDTVPAVAASVATLTSR